ncbi:MAG: virulence factor SrfC family protein, partial [Rhodospirillaceae bacterium]
MTETDIVKILANSFFLDFDPNNMTIPPVEEEQIRGLLSSLEGQAGTGVGSRSGEGSGHLDEIALFDLSQYFRQNFKSRIGAFDRVDYWRGLIALGGRLDREKRAALFEVLWGCLPEFTALYLHLVEALEQVGHAPEALVGLKGLIPREAGSPPEPNSIIDVAILSRMGSARDAQDTIPMRLSGADGPTDVALPRATLTALIAEICLTIQDSPWPFFDHTDLLDFPGARSRLKLLAMPPDAEEKESQKRELYLRGKIAYLFQRYTDELELTSMLLCMPPSVAEVKDLSALVKNWIEATHGATPERRKAVRNALFLVLTKHDMEFIEKGGETDDSRMGKWDRRLHASLLELYGKEGWPQNWDGKPFANTYFLRNPGMKQVHLMSYVDEAALIEDRPVDSPAFATYRQAFLTSPLTEKYFSDRPAAWEAAMAPNDGGIAYLVSALEGVLDPGLKQRQAAERLVDAAGSLDQPLRGLYFEDGDAALKEQDGKMLGLRKALHAGFKLTDLRGFALFLRSLMLDESEIREIFLTVAALRLDETGVLDGSGSESGSEAPVVAEEDDPWDDPWAEPDPSPAAEDQTAAARSGAPARRERADLFAERLMNHWAGKLREHGQNQALLTQLGLSADDYALVV